MPALQVRDFPEDLYEELRAAAVRNHRSIAQQTIAYVEAGLRGETAKTAPFDHLTPRPDSAQERLARTDKRTQIIEQARQIVWLKQPPSADEIRDLFREEDIEREKRQCEALGIPFREEYVR